MKVTHRHKTLLHHCTFIEWQWMCLLHQYHHCRLQNTKWQELFNWLLYHGSPVGFPAHHLPKHHNCVVTNNTEFIRWKVKEVEGLDLHVPSCETQGWTSGFWPSCVLILNEAGVVTSQVWQGTRALPESGIIRWDFSKPFILLTCPLWDFRTNSW